MNICGLMSVSRVVPTAACAASADPVTATLSPTEIRIWARPLKLTRKLQMPLQSSQQMNVINTGRAGQDPEIRVRGTNSINGYTPLYVVDGLFTDNINYLNTADIESMEILKDPSSLAIFGVRGANGVIIITTKKAKEGKTQVSINGSVGWKKVTDRVSLTNAEQYYI